MSIKDQQECPVCGANWNAGDIYEVLRNHDGYKGWTNEKILEAASHYGWSKENPKHFTRLIGIEILGQYDGVSIWRCPDCGSEWDRFTNKLIEK